MGMICVDCGTVASERWVFRRNEWRCEACDKKLADGLPVVHGYLNITLDPAKVK